MKDVKKTVVSIITLILICSVILMSKDAYASSSDDFVIENGILIEYSGNGGKVVIPEGVVEIEDMVFIGHDSITELLLPKTLTKIGSFAFSECSSLENLIIPENVKEIGNFAFSDCNNLKNITLGKGIVSIESVFIGCSSLKSIELPNSIKIIDDAFTNCTSLESISIPNSVTSMNYAFMNCTSLENVTIPNGVKSLERTFDGCTSLKNVTIPNSVTSMNVTFYNCKELIAIEIPSHVTSIYGAFWGCSNLEKISIPKSVTSMGFAFEGTPWLEQKRLERNDGIVIINNILIDALYAEGKVVIPKGVTKIEENAFYESEDVTSVVIPEGVTELGMLAFGSCTNLKTVTLPKSVKTIHAGAFMNCKKLNNIVIPKNVTYIGEYSFSMCPSLKTITFLNKKGTFTEEIFSPHIEIKFGNYQEYLDSLPSMLTIKGYKNSMIQELAENLVTWEYGNKQVKFVDLESEKSTVYGIKIPSSLSMNKGKSVSLKITLPKGMARVTNDPGSSGKINQVVIDHKSSNKKVATISSNGKITGKGKGTATITTTVTWEYGVKKTYTTKVTVK